MSLGWSSSAERSGMGAGCRRSRKAPLSLGRNASLRGVTRQTLGYRPPTFSDSDSRGNSRPETATTTPNQHKKRCDIEIPGGDFQLGAPHDAAFAFDNEKWAHSVQVRPFAIARTAVTQKEFAAFVNENGYGRREFWTDDAWRWREGTGAEHPVYWRREGSETWFR